jgi:hypothetical protein
MHTNPIYFHRSLSFPLLHRSLTNRSIKIIKKYKKVNEKVNNNKKKKRLRKKSILQDTEIIHFKRAEGIFIHHV